MVYTMDEEADGIIHSFRLSEEDLKKFKTVKESFHFIKKQNIIFKRTKFNLRVQMADDSIN